VWRLIFGRGRTFGRPEQWSDFWWAKCNWINRDTCCFLYRRRAIEFGVALWLCLLQSFGRRSHAQVAADWPRSASGSPSESVHLRVSTFGSSSDLLGAELPIGRIAIPMEIGRASTRLALAEECRRGGVSATPVRVAVVQVRTLCGAQLAGRRESRAACLDKINAPPVARVHTPAGPKGTRSQVVLPPSATAAQPTQSHGATLRGGDTCFKPPFWAESWFSRSAG